MVVVVAGVVVVVVVDVVVVEGVVLVVLVVEVEDDVVALLTRSATLPELCSLLEIFVDVIGAAEFETGFGFLVVVLFGGLPQ